MFSNLLKKAIFMLLLENKVLFFVYTGTHFDV